MKGDKADSIVDDKGNEVSIAYLHQCVDEANNANLIALFSDFEAGIFSFSKDEYLKLPNTFLESLRIWKRAKAQHDIETTKNWNK